MKYYKGKFRKRCVNPTKNHMLAMLYKKVCNALQEGLQCFTSRLAPFKESSVWLSGVLSLQNSLENLSLNLWVANSKKASRC